MLSFVNRIRQINNPPHGVDHDTKPDTKSLRFGCLGAAKITPGAVVKTAQTHPEVILYAVAARDTTRAEKFAKEHGFEKSYGGANGYQDMLDDPKVDVIYNPLPNGLHFEWTMKALKAGKHVLLEKPATDTADEASQIFQLAEKKGLVVLEAFHYRFHPAIQRMKAILESGELGAIKTVNAALTAPAGTIPDDDIRWDYNLGGGATMDPGTYTINVLRYLASSKPKVVTSASAQPFTSAAQHKQIDRQFTATIEFEDGSIGNLHSDLSVPKLLGIIPRLPKLSASVECERGSITIFNFLIPHYYHYITVAPHKGRKRTEKAYSFKGEAKGEDWWTTYRYQLEAFVDKVQGRTPQTWVSSQDTIENMQWIENIYAKDGFGSRPHSNYVYEDDVVIQTD